jgi:hypothetical protein
MKKKYLLVALLLSSFGIMAEETLTNETNLIIDNIPKVGAESTKPALEIKKTDIINSAITDNKKTLEPSNAEFKVIESIKKIVDDKTKTEVLPNTAPKTVLEVQPKANLKTKAVQETLKPKTKTTTTTTTVVKELNLVGPTQHNWWKWLGLLALLGALLGFLAATFRRKNYEKENHSTPKKKHHYDREVEFTFEEEKENKTSDKRNHNNDFKNRD